MDGGAARPALGADALEQIQCGFSRSCNVHKGVTERPNMTRHYLNSFALRRSGTGAEIHVHADTRFPKHDMRTLDARIMARMAMQPYDRNRSSELYALRCTCRE